MEKPSHPTYSSKLADWTFIPDYTPFGHLNGFKSIEVLTAAVELAELCLKGMVGCTSADITNLFNLLSVEFAPILKPKQIYCCIHHARTVLQIPHPGLKDEKIKNIMGGPFLLPDGEIL